MNRPLITPDDLNQVIKNEWRPVWAGFAEDSNCVRLPVVEIDFICEWRLPDGKIRFLAIKYETPEELQVIRDCLIASVPAFVQAMTEKFELREEAGA